MKMGDLYIGVSTDTEILQRTEGGGVVTSLLKFALEHRIVDAVFAVRKGNSRYEATPSFITDPEAVKECAGSFHFAAPGLAKNVKKYLDTRNEKIAVVCKPCDARALLELAKINQVNIDNIIIVGLNCSGTLAAVPTTNMLRECGLDPDALIGEDIDGEDVTFQFEGIAEKVFKVEELEKRGFGRRRNCQRCDYPIPRMADLACGKCGGTGERGTFVEVCSAKGKDLLARAVARGLIKIRPPSQKQITLRQQKEAEKIRSARARQAVEFGDYDANPHAYADLQSCTKCYGCRDVCPLCHCKVCVLERDEPETVEKGIIPPPPTFAMIRLYHVAPYCVNCGQCEDVCSADLPISSLAHYLNRKATDLFGYEPGLDTSSPLPLSAAPPECQANPSTELPALKS